MIKAQTRDARIGMVGNLLCVVSIDAACGKGEALSLSPKKTNFQRV